MRETFLFFGQEKTSRGKVVDESINKKFYLKPFFIRGHLVPFISVYI